MIRKNRKRGLGYRPVHPVINPMSPQAHGLSALLTTVDLHHGERPAETLGTWYRELAYHAGPLDDSNSNTEFPAIITDAEHGPLLGFASSGATGSRAGVNLPDSLWQEDHISFTTWVLAYSTAAGASWNVSGLGKAQVDADHVRLDVGQTNGQITGRYNGATTNVDTGSSATFLDGLQFAALTCDKSDLMRLYVWNEDGLQTFTADISGTGALTGATHQFYANYNSQAGLLESRYYQRVLSADEVWQMYSPETRWDLYRPVKRFWQLPPPPLPQVFFPIRR